MVCLALAGYISQQAIAVERKLITAVKMALAISASGDVNNPGWEPLKNDLLALTREGVAINPHYRKITPMVADELGRWGDWANALWVWESVVASRPDVVVILTNIARGYAQLGNTDKAMQYLARAEKLQPRSASVGSLKLVLLNGLGQERQALDLAKAYLQQGIYDLDMLNAAYVLGMQSKDAALVIQSLALREKNFPGGTIDTLLKLADVYAQLKNDDAQALAYYRQALAAAPPNSKEAVLQQIPKAFASRL